LSDSIHGGSLKDKMQGKSDSQLLREYAENGSEAAFSEIVARYTDLVYSSAVRQVGSPDLARDVAQSVFTDLARKAGSLARKLKENDTLMGWLYGGFHRVDGKLFVPLAFVQPGGRGPLRQRHQRPSAEAPLRPGGEFIRVDSCSFADFAHFRRAILRCDA